jgi:hypothetical protein
MSNKASEALSKEGGVTREIGNDAATINAKALLPVAG